MNQPAAPQVDTISSSRNGPPASGVDRALQIIYAVAHATSEGIGVSALSRQLDLPKAVAHRILKLLSADGFLAFDEPTKRYRLGPGALTVGIAAMRQLDLQQVVRPLLERLVDDTGETATLSLKQGWSRMYVDQVLSPQEIRMSVTTGQLYPLHAGASSKAVLAALPEPAVEQYLSTHSLDHVTTSTIASREQLLAEIMLIRSRGYAVSAGERDAGAASVAAAIRGPQGQVMGSISLCGPLARFEQAELSRYGRLVVAAAKEASIATGYQPDR